MISPIDGMGGRGKTVHAACRLTARYPDAKIRVDMAGTSAASL